MRKQELIDKYTCGVRYGEIWYGIYICAESKDEKEDKMSKNEFYRGHCINDKGEPCPHIKGARDDTPCDEVTMGCEYGDKNCPYVKEDDNEQYID